MTQNRIFQFPPETFTQDSFQKFQEICREKLAARGMGSRSFIPEQVQGINKVFYDGNFILSYEDPARDFYCDARIDANHREMVVLAGNERERRDPNLGTLVVIKDQCSLTEATFGKEELGSSTCVNGVADSRLAEAVKKSELYSLETYHQFCTRRFDHHVQKFFGPHSGRSFAMDRVRLEVPQRKTNQIKLSYESQGNDFFCEAALNTSAQTMDLRSGHARRKDATPVEERVILDDACALQAELIGAEQTLSQCVENDAATSRTEQVLDRLTPVVLNALWFGIPASRFLSPRLVGLFHAANAQPFNPVGQRLLTLRAGMEGVFRNAGAGFFFGKVYDVVAAVGLKVAEDHPARTIGTPLAAIGGMGAVMALETPAVAEMLATRATARTALTRAGAATRVLGNALLAVEAINWGASWLLIEDDYEKWVNNRAAENFYQRDIAENDAGYFKTGFRLGLGALWPEGRDLIAAGKRPEEVEAVRRADREASAEIKRFMRQVLPTLALEQKSDSPSGKEEWLNFWILTQRPYADEASEVLQIAEHLYFFGAAGAQGKFGYTKEQLQTGARRLLQKEIQEYAAFLVAVDIPQNDWAREVFDADGSLEYTEVETLLRHLYGSEENWPHRDLVENSLLVHEKAQREYALAQAEIAHSYGLEMR